ncbi:hypothetical protein MNEG_8751 [Monoraphidium neglectum]|uniref:DUF7906 domain-containing protein n=1 Tax=Monoraphidium neglectum TaxID=145388 RepID=A0A0D2M782_9CHLO|nr:hypothetical protein MNEG_8751 [Monoraphidium neglectum]KIY99214.1 hypothetical protein MNEG_8751 [Monoraphidium neglectum]|eukprot:XP_013898234.1 hypothetical protein MNEG_8751 [Monoraphidium neglectum]
MARSGVPAWLACLLLSTALASTCGEPERKLTRQKARNWDAEARKRAASSAKAFLEQADQSLVVPVEVDVFLIGFEADGGYAHKVDSMMLQNLLNAGEEVTHCPRSLDTRGDLGLCFKVHYQVLGHAELGGEAGQLLRNIEAYLKPNLKDPFEAMPWARPRGRGTPGTPEPGHLEPTEYTVDAAGLEPLFEAFLEFAYGVSSSESDEAAKAGHNWHQHNPIFIINPSKVRINPKGHPEDQNHHVPDFFYQWHRRGGGPAPRNDADVMRRHWAEGGAGPSQIAPPQGRRGPHTYKPEELEKEEAGLTYRYSYNGAGASAAWCAPGESWVRPWSPETGRLTSSRNFVVVDVAAGPAIYGPAVAGRGGVVGPTSFPSLRDVYRAIFADLKDVGPTLTAQEHAQVVAEHAQRALFDGALSSTIVSATRSLFLPDTTTEHLEYARSLLVGGRG